MKTINHEYVTPQIRDELAGMTEDFELVTKSNVKKVRGFEKSFKGCRLGFNVYVFTKSVQMSTRSIGRRGL